MPTTDQISWVPELLFEGGSFQRNRAVVCDDNGRIADRPTSKTVENPIELKGRAVLPGLINAHSHAFQRVIRGRTEYRTTNDKDSFWSWREMMYSAATRLSPDDVYDASRMAFLEMALTGITSVGEFHYLHHAPDGAAYDDPNLLSKQVVRAAEDVGLRIALLRVAYARSGFETAANPLQRRFIEIDPDIYSKNVAQLSGDLKGGSPAGGQPTSWCGVAPHSIRAVPLAYLRQVIEFGASKQLPIHMHIAEQQAEVSASIAEYGRSPVALLSTEGLLSKRFTAVHSIHVTPKAIAMLAGAGASVCACPTTERNLGDGILPVDEYLKQGVRMALGTDSHIQIDLLEDARELEYHLRLQRMERVVLVQRAPSERSPEPQSRSNVSDLAAVLFDCATARGAESINSPGGTLAEGYAADFFTVELDDPSIAGASDDDLLSSIVFSLSRTAVKDVVVGGRRIVEDGRHKHQQEIVERFRTLQKKLWA